MKDSLSARCARLNRIAFHAVDRTETGPEDAGALARRLARRLGETEAAQAAAEEVARIRWIGVQAPIVRPADLA